MAKKSALSEILSTGVPETLYHYTNSTGLMGIIRSKQIWTTKITYLNDRAELQLAVDYIRDEIDRQRKSIGRNKQAVAELDSKEYVLDGIDEVNVSVASFTEEGDQLSQWRGYCDIGQGYSLGFNGQSLLDQANAEGFHLVPCVYEEEERKLIVREIVESTNEIDISENPNYDGNPPLK